MTGNGPHCASVRSALEWGMSHPGVELSSLPHFPAELGELPATHWVTQENPNKKADNHD